MPYEVEMENTLTLAGNQVYQAWIMYGIFPNETSNTTGLLEGALT